MEIWTIQNPYSKAFFTGRPKSKKWSTDVRDAKFYKSYKTARSIQTNMLNNKNRFSLDNSVDYLWIINYVLVEGLPF